jgi:hypothetical protein
MDSKRKDLALQTNATLFRYLVDKLPLFPIQPKLAISHKDNNSTTINGCLKSLAVCFIKANPVLGRLHPTGRSKELNKEEVSRNKCEAS